MSEYGLAIAFTFYVNDPVERRLRLELLVLSWTKTLKIPLSITDINQASLNMACTMVQDNSVIYGNNNYRCIVEELLYTVNAHQEHLQTIKYLAKEKEAGYHYRC